MMSGEEGSRHSDSKDPAQPPVLAGIRHEEVLQSETLTSHTCLEDIRTRYGQNSELYTEIEGQHVGFARAISSAAHYSHGASGPVG